MKTFLLSLALCLPAFAQTAPPATVTRTLTNGATSLTVRFTHHPIRRSNHNVRVQDASGTFSLHTPDVPRTYIGTVDGRPGAIAAGLQRANGTFLSFVVFEDGTSWSSSGTSATTSGNANWPAAYPTTGVGSGGAGSSVYGAELGIDASHRHFTATGSDIDACVELTEFYVMKANVVYLRDAAILHRIGRFVIRTSSTHCPYEPLGGNMNDLLNKFRDQWNNVLPAAPHHLPRTHDVALMSKPGVGGGLAWVGAVANSNAYSINGASSSGDFSTIWRHEAGHNWGSSHYEGGGKPEGPTIMSDNSLARFSSSELAKIIAYRNTRLGNLDNLGSYHFALPPRANQDRVTMASGSGGIPIDVLANDSDSNGENLSILSHDSRSALGALVGVSPGSGPGGRDRLVVYSPPGFSTGFDHFNHRIRDTAGQVAMTKVYVNPTALPPLPPAWTGTSTGTGGEAGSGPDGTVVVYTGSGDIWGNADTFRFVSIPSSGDADLIARVSAQAISSTWAKAGLMLRADAAADSPHAYIYLTPSNGLRFLHRTAAGATAVSTGGPQPAPAPDNWLRLTRSGDTFTGRVSSDGTNWTQVATATIPMGSDILAGLAVAGNSAANTGGAAFDHIRFADRSPHIDLVADGFDGGSPFRDPGDPLDTRWTATGFDTSVISDTPLGGGNALDASPTGTFASLRGDFAGRALALPGDTLRLSFDFRHTSAPSNAAAGFRFGLHDRSGAGYTAHHGTGGNSGFSLLRGPDGFGSGGNLATLASSSKSSLANTAKRQAVFLLKRTPQGIDVTATIDGASLSASDSSPSALTGFDTICIRNGNLSAGIRIDNVRLEAATATIESWRAATFGDRAGETETAGDDADPDGDGLVNLVEYALGLSPLAFSPAPAISRENGRFGIEYPVDSTASDVIVTPEWSSDLVTWQDNGLLVEIVAEDASGRTLRASVPAAPSPLFLRLRVMRR